MSPSANKTLGRTCDRGSSLSNYFCAGHESPQPQSVQPQLGHSHLLQVVPSQSHVSHMQFSPQQHEPPVVAVTV